MPDYLVILLCVTAGLISLMCLFALWILRRMSIIGKKVDYLVEDITYKLETLSPFIDSLLKLSSYLDVVDVIIKQNGKDIKKIVNDNKPAIAKFKDQLTKVINEK